MAGAAEQHWESVYSTKGAETVSWFEKTPKLSVELIQSCNLDPSSARIIDVGGGASALAETLLVDTGFSSVTVLDLSQTALNVARERMGPNVAARCTFLHQDILTMEPPPKPFDLWHDRAVFHFMKTEEQKLRYLTVLRASLARKGYLILATFSKAGPLKCSGLDVEQYDASKMQAVLGDDFLLLRTVIVQHTTPAGGQQEFCYALFQKNH